MDEIKIERELYGPTKRFLNVSFVTKLREVSGLQNLELFASETALTASADGGQWTRPDVSALVIGRGQFIPHWKADLHTFEVKTASGLDETSVHEANAHGRFGHYAWLVFQCIGRAARDSALVSRRIYPLASHLGVGLISFEDPDKPNSWSIQAWPRRTGSDAASADNFIAERFSAEERARIAGNLKALGWGGEV